MKILTTSAQRKLAPIKAAVTPRSLKVTTAIEPDPKFYLVGRERYMHALYFYNNKFRRGRPEWTWASLISQALFPNWAQKPLNPRLYKETEAVWKTAAKLWTERGLAASIGVKKDLGSKRFVATVPLIAFPLDGYPEGMGRTAVGTSGKNSMSEPNWREAVVDRNAPITEVRTFDLGTFKPIGSINQKDIDHLKAAHAKLIIRPMPGFVMAFMQLEFTQREAEFLCNTAWLEIRPLDFYGVIRAWVDGHFGVASRSPTFSIPLGRIAKASDAKVGKPRLSTDGLLLDEHATMMSIPTNLNDITSYEDSAASAYTHEDGSFSAIGEDGKMRKPPPAMPVYVDWVNLKFAYTSLDGKLMIQNLDRSQALNVTHIRRFLDRNLTNDAPANFLSFTNRLGAFLGVIPEHVASTFTETLLFAVSKENGRRDRDTDLSTTPLITIYTYSDTNEACRDFVGYAKKIQTFIEQNPRNAYAKYSVPTIVELLAQLKVFNKYAPNFGQVVAQDNAKREGYIKQGEDPNWKPEQLPFVLPERGLMPHQGSVQNKVRHNPDNAVYPVDAGGGKTTLIVYDVLRNMKTIGSRLQLIMCPSHLVAQYVKEFVYFSGSQVNVIPVTTYTIRRHGLARLGTMIQNAPHNTVIVTDYNAIVYKTSVISYGVAPIRLYPIIDFLRQFDFAYVASDESHWLKNGSSRNAAAARLFIEIDKKRLASGTMVADTIIDLVRQTALMDPSIFGTVDDFIKEYALEMRGSKVLEWKPGAELAVQRLMESHVVFAGAKRKEWAAILPFPKEKFHPTSLTPNQFQVYQNILQSIREQLEKAAQENESLRKLLAGEEDADNPEINIDAMLKPYLARLERFLTAPGKDLLGKETLKGPDLISPKVLKIIEICKEHLDQGINGKVLIFTNYEFSAQAIYEGLESAGLKAQTVYYTAGNKEECGAEFEKNPKKTIMVGIEQSMNTGLNLQHASRLIRVETVWTPGVLEQGNSRIGRPNIKDREARPFIYYDWILTNQTIDVTKISYLMAKTISKAKFDEAGNPKFDDLEVPPLFSMTLDTVFAMNNVEEHLMDYFEKYEAYKKALFGEYETYRTKYKDKLFDKDGKLRMSLLERAAPPAESAVMKLLPYVPGTELYQADKLGLVRYDAYMRLEEAELEDAESEDGEEGPAEDSEDEEDDANSELNAEREKAIGLPVHTEFGDGEIVGLNRKILRIKLPSGDVFPVRKLAAFVITRANTSGKDLRQQLLKLNGDLPLDTPLDVPSAQIVKVKPPKVGKKGKGADEETTPINEETSIEMELDFTVVNDFLGLRLVNMDNEQAVRVAQSLGFSHPKPYIAALIKKPFILFKQFKRWKEQGFIVDKDNNAMCALAYKHFKANVGSGGNFYGVANENNIRNFYRMEFKPNPDKMHINPYPMIQDGRLYLALPIVGQPGTKNAISPKARIPEIKWIEYDPKEELIVFTPKKEQASKLIKTILSEGVTIPNLKELNSQFRKLRIARDDGKDE